MGKRTRRLMEGFALGALSEVSRQQRVAFETKQAQEAEALREQRLAAIRAEERQHQDRIYERNAQRDDQRFERQLDIESKRDQRELDQQMSAEQRAEERQRRLMREQAGLRAPPNVGMSTFRTPEGRIVSMRDDDPRLLTGLPQGWDHSYARATTASGVESPAAATPAPSQPQQVTKIGDPPPEIAKGIEQRRGAVPKALDPNSANQPGPVQFRPF